MMKKYFAILLTLLCFCMCFVPCNTVLADGPDATIIFSSSSVDVGEDITVTLRFKNDAATISKIDGYLTYDASVIECTSATGGGGNLHILENATPAVDSLDVTLTFRALKAGSSKLEINCNLIDENEATIGAVAAGATLTVTNPTVFLSNNANLASLTVSYGTLAPEFSPEITEYTVLVENSVNKFPLSAKAEDANATIAITGSQNLIVGINQRVVTVTAQDGTQKAYTVTIVRAEPLQTATPAVSDTPTKAPTDKPTTTPSHTQIQWGTQTPTQDTTPEVSPSTTPEVTVPPTQTAAPTPSSTPNSGMTVNQLKNTVLIVIVILAIIIIVILFTVVYCMQQKDQKKRGGKGSRSSNKSGNRRRR